MSGMARPAKRRRLRRAADIALVVLAVVALGLFVAVKIIGGRGGAGKAPNGQASQTAGGASSIGPENGAATAGDFADLEAGPDEFDADPSGEPLAGPAIVSDPYVSRPL